jgi:hypothetical protein
MKKPHVLVAVLWLGLSLPGCRRKPPETASPVMTPSADTPSVKIWVSTTGLVELNGHQSDLAAISVALADLAKRQGTVLYGREAPDQEPHPNGLKVIEMVVANRLPIRMSTKRDFSDAVTADGKSKE